MCMMRNKGHVKYHYLISNFAIIFADNMKKSIPYVSVMFIDNHIILTTYHKEPNKYHGKNSK